ncbi:hypothetical protein CUMW_088850, partial [Citrus unshiu]
SHVSSLTLLRPAKGLKSTSVAAGFVCDGIPEEAIVSAEHLIDESWMIEQQSNEVDDSEFTNFVEPILGRIL